MRCCHIKHTGRTMSRYTWYMIGPLVVILASLPAKGYAQHRFLATDLGSPRIVVIDPGHGGRDCGAVGPSGLAEKRVTVTLAKKLKRILAKTHTVYLTREGDYRVEIEKRTALANHRRGDIFISLHAGGSFQHKARGMAIFYYGPGTGQEPTIRQGEPMGEKGGELPQWDHIQEMHRDKSKLLAGIVHRELFEKLSPIDRGVHRAPCSVLQGADMPGILVEIGYLSHPAEEKELKDPKVISSLSQAIAQGVREFFRQTGSCVDGKGMIEEDIGTGRGAAW